LVKLRLHTLDRKLLRDLLRMKMQLAAVGGVLACGIVLWVMANGMYDSLQRARDVYYEQEHMADMAARVVRAPLQLADSLCATWRQGYRVSGCLISPTVTNRSQRRWYRCCRIGTHG
jgi:hypothetical protein